jgi:hypothetical protein
MKCGHCKRAGESITVKHVRECALTVMGAHTVEAPVRTWQENKAVAVAKVLDSRPANPATVKAPVPAGRYAIDYGNGVVKFFKVDVPVKGKWTGYTFVKRVAGDDEWPVRDYGQRSSILQIIGEDVLKASKLYGTEIGACGVCGRTLTDPESRAAGIGPVCAAKF